MVDRQEAIQTEYQRKTCSSTWSLSNHDHVCVKFGGLPSRAINPDARSAPPGLISAQSTRSLLIPYLVRIFWVAVYHFVLSSLLKSLLLISYVCIEWPSVNLYCHSLQLLFASFVPSLIYTKNLHKQDILSYIYIYMCRICAIQWSSFSFKSTLNRTISCHYPGRLDNRSNCYRRPPARESSLQYASTVERVYGERVT